MNKAAFLDRDGVLIVDAGFFNDPCEMKLFEQVPDFLSELKKMGFLLIVITNQAVIARGICSETEVVEANKYLSNLITANGGPLIDAFYFCPHHPNADLAEYRKNCNCRKPAPGMILGAVEDFDIDVSKSFMIGDRISDVIAGREAGCKSILLQTGRHSEEIIESKAEVDWKVEPDCICDCHADALNWIKKNQ